MSGQTWEPRQKEWRGLGAERGRLETVASCVILRMRQDQLYAAAGELGTRQKGRSLLVVFRRLM